MYKGDHYTFYRVDMQQDDDAICPTTADYLQHSLESIPHSTYDPYTRATYSQRRAACPLTTTPLYIFTVLAMVKLQMDVGPQAIGCETCERMGWDDGSWSKWTEPGSGSRTFRVCHQCLSSPRSYWKELFSLCQKSGVGTVHLPQSEQATASGLEESCIAFDQQPEDISVVEQYRKLEDLFEHTPLAHGQIRLLSLLPSENDVLCTIE